LYAIFRVLLLLLRLVRKVKASERTIQSCSKASSERHHIDVRFGREARRRNKKSERETEGRREEKRKEQKFNEHFVTSRVAVCCVSSSN
jgi:hypothetical protein